MTDFISSGSNLTGRIADFTLDPFIYFGNVQSFNNSSTSYLADVNYPFRLYVTGHDFIYDSNQHPVSGTITEIDVISFKGNPKGGSYAVDYAISNIAISQSQAYDLYKLDYKSVISLLYSGDDNIVGTIQGDTFLIASGHDVVDGRSGSDTAVFNYAFKDAHLSFSGAAVIVDSEQNAAILTNVESLQFSDLTINRFETNSLVDAFFYASKNPDVIEAGIKPSDHYNQYGFQEGRDPNLFFSTVGYLATNPDVKAAGVNPLQQYDAGGWKEGRDPSANFDTELYLEHNSDVKAAGIDPLKHYLQYGQAEGREAFAAVGNVANFTHGSFDARYYLLSNVDVAAAALQAGGDTFAFAYNHYETYGWHEGRNPNSYFDVKGYLNIYKDVASSGIDPLMHYDQYGWKEGRDPSVHFDTKSYVNNNSDVAYTHIDPLLHFLTYGIHEGRSSFDDGHFG